MCHITVLLYFNTTMITMHILYIIYVLLATIGTIPETLCDCIHLKRLLLNNNDFTGPIPSNIGKMKALQEINLAHNRLSQEIPISLSNCTLLTTCMLHNNAFSGVIHESIMSLKHLTALHLQNNTGAMHGTCTIVLV